MDVGVRLEFFPWAKDGDFATSSVNLLVSEADFGDGGLVGGGGDG